MKFKRIVAIVLSVTTLLSNVTQTSFADEISEAEQDKNESIRQDSIANQTTAPNETTSLNQEYVTNRNSGTTEAEGIGSNINENEAPEKNKVEITINENDIQWLESYKIKYNISNNENAGQTDHSQQNEISDQTSNNDQNDDNNESNDSLNNVNNEGYMSRIKSWVGSAIRKAWNFIKSIPSFLGLWH